MGQSPIVSSASASGQRFAKIHLAIRNNYKNSYFDGHNCHGKSHFVEILCENLTILSIITFDFARKI